jgi:hypothetical protein
MAAMVLVAILGSAVISTAQTIPQPDYTQKAVNGFIGYSYPITDPNRIIEKNVSFSFEQTVQGNGYYMAYKYAKMGNVEFKDYAHGSGSLDNEAILASYDATKKYHLWNADWNDYNVSCIQYKETTHAVYAPTRIAVGTGYYAANPLNYDSLIKEETWLKNRRAGTSMENQVEYAHKLDKDLSLTVKDYTNFTYDPLFTSNAFSQMKVKEDVAEGKIHIGVLQANTNTGTTLFDSANHLNSAWKGKPAIEIDEDYWGTYHVEKNMTLSVPYSRNQPVYDWLPCTCGAGWNDMVLHDTRYHSAKGFFDCTTCMPPAPCSTYVPVKKGPYGY